MGQIPYTLTFKLGKPNRFKECLVYLRYYSKEHDIELPTKIRVEKKYFDGSKKNPIIKHPNANEYNVSLNNFKLEVDNRAVKNDAVISKLYLEGNNASSNLITEFIDEFIKLVKAENAKNKDDKKPQGRKQKGRISEGRLKIYTVIKNKIADFDKKATFRSVNMEWLLKLEKHIRDTGIGDNTISTNMSVVKSILNKAKDLKRINKEQFEAYIPPGYEEDIPVYMREPEIESYYSVVKVIADEVTKTCGYYYLLACYASYRISDLFAFDYNRMVRGDSIILRAKKNGNIVSIYIYSRLREIVNYCKDHKITVTEEEMRKKVKFIGKLSGFHDWRRLTPHSGRHSFAMLMLAKGLTIDEVAELLGDSKDVAKRYARIINPHLHKRVKEVMK